MHSKFSNSHLFAFVCGALVVAIAFGMGVSVASLQRASAAEPAQAVQQWEILMVDVVQEGFAALMNGQYANIEDAAAAVSARVYGLGAQGWELVDVEYSASGGEIMFFQRPLQPGSAPFTPPTPSGQSGNPGVG